MKQKKRKQALVLIFVALCLSVFVVVFKMFFEPMSVQFSSITIGEKTFVLERKETRAEQTEGLSRRASLAEDQGLLFVFEEFGMHGFWMKEMNFPISIIWLDDECKVTGFKHKATPESFPEVFYPELPSRYVVETNPLPDEVYIGDRLLCDHW
jgi:hypothetical protein